MLTNDPNDPKELPLVAPRDPGWRAPGAPGAPGTDPRGWHSIPTSNPAQSNADGDTFEKFMDRALDEMVKELGLEVDDDMVAEAMANKAIRDANYLRWKSPRPRWRPALHFVALMGMSAGIGGMLSTLIPVLSVWPWITVIVGWFVVSMLAAVGEARHEH